MHNIQDFISFVTENLKNWGVKTEMSPERQVYTGNDGTGFACSGFFSELPELKLAVAMGKPEKEWLSILAHEYSHATQWKEQSPYWTNLFKDWGQGKEEATEALDRWLQGEEWGEEKIAEVIACVRDVERDCEERTVKLIHAFNLPIDAEEYTQKANAYVYFYNWLGKTRQWYEAGLAPYEIEDIWRSAPKSFSYSAETPKELEEAFQRNYALKSTIKPPLP